MTAAKNIKDVNASEELEAILIQYLEGVEEETKGFDYCYKLNKNLNMLQTQNAIRVQKETQNISNRVVSQ